MHSVLKRPLCLDDRVASPYDFCFYTPRLFLDVPMTLFGDTSLLRLEFTKPVFGE